jgi:6-pyruvoyl-tetrahydropterin synthase
MKKIIIIKTSFEATHCWPECNISYVHYLKNQHRHIFYVEVGIAVEGDRQVEFITFKRQVESYIAMNFKGLFLGSKSCEQIAEELLNHFNAKVVSVFEDNENGVEVYV